MASKYVVLGVKEGCALGNVHTKNNPMEKVKIETQYKNLNKKLTFSAIIKILKSLLSNPISRFSVVMMFCRICITSTLISDTTPPIALGAWREAKEGLACIIPGVFVQRKEPWFWATNQPSFILINLMYYRIKTCRSCKNEISDISFMKLHWPSSSTFWLSRLSPLLSASVLKYVNSGGVGKKHEKDQVHELIVEDLPSSQLATSKFPVARGYPPSVCAFTTFKLSFVIKSIIDDTLHLPFAPPVEIGTLDLWAYLNP